MSSVGVLAPGGVLDARVDVFGVLAENHDVELLRLA